MKHWTPGLPDDRRDILAARAQEDDALFALGLKTCSHVTHTQDVARAPERSFKRGKECVKVVSDRDEPFDSIADATRAMGLKDTGSIRRALLVGGKAAKRHWYRVA